MRPLAILAGAALVQACSLAPQLAPTAAGCYAVQLDSVPAQFPAMLVPPAPDLIKLDTAFGGQVQVPRAWLEAQGLNIRSAALGLVRPDWRITNGLVVTDRSSPRPFPPDTLALVFGGGAATLTALLGAEPSGDWRGWAFALPSAKPLGQPLVPVWLQRMSCGRTPMALSR
jgi:hypothetical protein